VVVLAALAERDRRELHAAKINAPVATKALWRNRRRDGDPLIE
jgi:hypothetical protein